MYIVALWHTGMLKVNTKIVSERHAELGIQNGNNMGKVSFMHKTVVLLYLR